jgi:MerR-like DNA binding protein
VTIGQVALRARVRAATIRFYERRGLRAGMMDRKIAMLQAMRGSLKRLVQTCGRPQKRRDCPLLDALEEAAK